MGARPKKYSTTPTSWWADTASAIFTEDHRNRKAIKAIMLPLRFPVVIMPYRQDHIVVKWSNLIKKHKPTLVLHLQPGQMAYQCDERGMAQKCAYYCEDYD